MLCERVPGCSLASRRLPWGFGQVGIVWRRPDWAPILIATLPCAIMCALGVCMGRLMPHVKTGSWPTRLELTNKAGDRK